MTTSEKTTKSLSALVIILSFMMIFLPAQLAFPLVQKIIIAVCGGLSVLLQIYIIFITTDKTKKTQSYILLALSIILICLMIYVYGIKASLPI